MRGVCCGNFQAPSPSEQVFTQNVEISSVRMALVVAARCRWRLQALDAPTAFLNAPLPASSGRVVVRPPKLFVDFGLVGKDELWIVNKGLYGLRVAPRAWGLERDSDLAKFRFRVGGVAAKMVKSRSDPSVWLVVAETEPKCETQRELLGLCLVYVDDFLLAGPDGVLDSLERLLKATWNCSVTQRIGGMTNGVLKYLSLEVEARNGSFVVHQSPYLDEMLQKWGLESANPVTSIVLEPRPRKPEEGDEDRPELDLQTVRMAQKMAGGLIWLATRSRPDISYAVSQLSSFCVIDPEWSLRLGKRILRYLIGTRAYAMLIPPVGPDFEEQRAAAGGGSPPGGVPPPGGPRGGASDLPFLRLDVFADASFEATTAQSGCSVFLGGVLIDWRSQKQAQIARSTAEAEITALNLGVHMLEGSEAVLHSMCVSTKAETPTLWGDNSASLLIAEGQGSWRTRALSNRAVAIRSRVEMGMLIVNKVSSEEQRGDGLTKCNPAPIMGRIREHFGLVALLDRPRLRAARAGVPHFSDRLSAPLRPMSTGGPNGLDF